MPNVVVAYNAPIRASVGSDGIPNYLSAESGQIARWSPPPGYQLRVYLNGRELFFVVEADRARGWARTLPWVETPHGPQQVDKRAEDGTPIIRLYHGEISFSLVPAHVPGWLRRMIQRAR